MEKFGSTIWAAATGKALLLYLFMRNDKNQLEIFIKSIKNQWNIFLELRYFFYAYNIDLWEHTHRYVSLITNDSAMFKSNYGNAS